MMAALFQDLRYALRMMRKAPAFTVVAALTLALGIGANTAIFTVFNAALLQPLPYENPGRLAHLFETSAREDFNQFEASYPNYLDWTQQTTLFEGLAGYSGAGFTILAGDTPERISASRATANFFKVLGVRPQHGRDFLPAEDQPNSSVVLLTHGYWVRRFGANPDFLGQSLNMDGVLHTVIGVLPENFHFAPRGSSEAWVPLNMSDDERTRRSRHWLNVIGRLKEGVTLEQAQSEMNGIARRLAVAYPQFSAGNGARVIALPEYVAGPVRPLLLVLMGSVLCVLLIACVNVANLLLARATTREREMAIRAALGAGRMRLVRQVLVESVLLALIAAALGAVWAVWGVDLLLATIPTAVLNSMPYLNRIGLNAPVLIFTALISIATGVAFGLVPALSTSRFSLQESLKEGARDSGGPARHALRRFLVVSEVALALVLLIGAGLMTRSLNRLLDVKLGFNPEKLLTFRVLLPASKYTQPAQVTVFFQQLRQRAETVPGVRSVTTINSLPVTNDGNTNLLEIEGRPAAPGQEPEAAVRVVSPNYFSAMGIPLPQGRSFNEHDRAAALGVMIVNQSFVRRFMDGSSPVGRKVVFTSNRSSREVIGIAGDVRLGSFDLDIRPTVYLCDLQTPVNTTSLVVRAAGEPLRLLSALRAEVQALDKDLPLFLVRTMDQIVDESPSVFNRRFLGMLLGALSGVALVLACVGLYGVINYSVTQRRQEIGIRMALGAQSGNVLGMFLSQGMKLVWLGIAFGLAGAFAVTRAMRTLLYGVSATDPVTFTSVALLLAAVALLATYIPARRATRVNPIVALRHE